MDDKSPLIVIITGAGTGMGRSAAIKLARLGHIPIINGRREAPLAEVRKTIESEGGKVVVEPGDVTDMAVIRRITDNALKRFGRIDVLVNNAGYATHNRQCLTVTPEEFDEVMRVNLWAPIFFTQAVLPSMLRAKKGTIIVVSSKAAQNPGGLGGPLYGAAKAGAVNFVKYVNNELKNTGIRACAIIPGETDTPILEKRPVVPDAAARATMMGADDVGDAIVLAATLPQRAVVEELTIRQTYIRDYSKEIAPLRIPEV